MKINLFYITILLFFILPVKVSAQSDYEIVKNFKETASNIEEEIKDADSLAALKKIQLSIDRLKRDFIANEELLDRSLYPESFNSTIEKLNILYKLRQRDFEQIVGLHTEVTGLKTEVDTLNRRNTELALQFEELEKRTSSMISKLEKDIAELIESLRKRDIVVMSMIDSLLPVSGDAENLSSEEREQFLSKAEQSNILSHIKNAVNDNIRFLNATKLQSEDIEELKNRQYNFFRIWRSVGPVLVEIYSEKGKSTNDLKEIDEAFSRWHSELNREVWESIRTEFAKNDINLQDFSNGKEFTAVIINYINDEIKNADINNNAEATYKKFVDSTWYKSVKPEWVVFLKDNEMLEEEEEDSIEVMIASWKNTVYPDGVNWLYIVIAVLVIALLIFLFIRKNKKSTQPSNIA